MPGFEFLGDEELEKISQIFSKNGGVLFSIGADRLRRNSSYITRDLEDQLKPLLSVPHVQVVSSGSAALYIALKSLSIGPGDEVLTSAFNFIGDIEALLMCGAKPVVVDIDESLQIDPKAVERSLSAKTKALLVPHMMGQAAPLDVLLKIAENYRIPLIEDACQALGGTYRGKMLGSLGKLGFYSLDYGKIVTCGEGGILVTEDSDLYRKFNEAHNHGRWSHREEQSSQLSSQVLGFNFRMTELQAATAQVQFEKFHEILKRTRENSRILSEILKSELPSSVRIRSCVEECDPVGDTLVLFVSDPVQAQRFWKELSAEGVGTKLLPNDLAWHFAGCWENLWNQYDSQLSSASQNWSKSREILERALGITVWARWDSQKCFETAHSIAKIAKKLF